MVFNLSNELDRERLQAAVRRDCEKGKLVEYKAKTTRTLSQNNYLHVIIRYFAATYGITEAEAKLDCYKRAANRDLFVRRRENRTGEMVSYVRSTRELSTAEMSMSIDRFKDWAARGGYFIPDNKPDMISEMQKIIDANSQWL